MSKVYKEKNSLDEAEGSTMKSPLADKFIIFSLCSYIPLRIPCSVSKYTFCCKNQPPW